jgi:hypothetical protein
MRFMVLNNRSTVAMIVAALGGDGRSVGFYGLLGDGASLKRRLLGCYGDVRVVFRDRA